MSLKVSSLHYMEVTLTLFYGHKLEFVLERLLSVRTKLMYALTKIISGQD